MTGKIFRETQAEKAVIANGAAISGVIRFANMSGGTLLMPAAWTTANVGFKICDTADGTFLPLLEEDGSTYVEIVSPAVDTAYNLPAKLFGALYFKVWSSDGAGSDTNQGAERTITIAMKT